MLAFTHTITGAAAGAVIQNPLIALATGAVLHLFLDTFVHWNFYYHRHRHIAMLAVLDLAAGVLVTYLLLGNEMFTPSILAGMLGGNLPDFYAFVYYLRYGKSHRGFMGFHDHIQQETYSLPRGLAGQFIAVAIALWFLR